METVIEILCQRNDDDENMGHLMASDLQANCAASRGVGVCVFVGLDVITQVIFIDFMVEADSFFADPFLDLAILRLEELQQRQN